MDADRLVMSIYLGMWVAALVLFGVRYYSA